MLENYRGHCIAEVGMGTEGELSRLDQTAGTMHELVFFRFLTKLSVLAMTEK